MLLRPVLMPVLRNPLQGIADSVRDFLAELRGSSQFWADLTHTAIPIRSGGETATYTGGATYTVNNDGYLVQGLANEIMFPGARRIRNQTVGSSEDLTNVAWVNASGASHTANTVTFIASADSAVYQAAPVQGGTYSKTVAVSMVVSVVSGTGQFRIQADHGGVTTQRSTDKTATTTPTRFSFVVTNPAAAGSGSQEFGIINGTGAAAATFTVTDFQLEDVTAQTTQTAGEYVSVGVESAPYYHGSMVDGVKCFGTDLSGNPLPTAYTYDAVSLNGVAGTYVSTPDSVAASITGDIDIRVKAALTDWTPAANTVLLAKRNGTGEYYLAVLTNGTLDFEWWDSGGVNRNSVSTVATGLTDGVTKYVRVTLDIDNGAGGNDVKFYLSDDGAAWIQLGATVTQAFTTSIRDTTDTIDVGSQLGGAASNLSGRIYQAQIYNGINGTLAVDFNASRYAGGTTLTGSTGETWTLQGNAVIHPTNTPMARYKPEPAATNLCLRSNAFTTTWIQENVTSNVQNATGPDGATSAWTITDNDALQTSRVYQAISVTAAAHTWSIKVKKTTGTQTAYPLMSISNGTTWALYTIDTSNGVVTPWTAATGLTMLAGVSARCTSFNSAFWLVEMIATTTALSFSFSIRPAGTTNPTQSSGTIGDAAMLAAVGSHVFSDSQVELGSTATSYIPTTTAAVTRNADILTYTGGNVANFKTLHAGFRREVGVSSVPAIICSLSDGTLNEYIYNGSSQLGATDIYFQGADGGVTQWQRASSNVYTPGTTSKVASSWATNDVKMDKDGTAQTPDAVATIPTVTQLHIGNIVGLNQLNGNVGPVAAWTRNLSQSELGAIDRA